MRKDWLETGDEIVPMSKKTQCKQQKNFALPAPRAQGKGEANVFFKYSKKCKGKLKRLIK